MDKLALRELGNKLMPNPTLVAQVVAQSGDGYGDDYDINAGANWGPYMPEKWNNFVDESCTWSQCAFGNTYMSALSELLD